MYPLSNVTSYPISEIALTEELKRIAASVIADHDDQKFWNYKQMSLMLQLEFHKKQIKNQVRLVTRSTPKFKK